MSTVAVTPCITVGLAKTQFAEGKLLSCDISVDTETGTAKAIIYPKEGEHAYLASARNPYEIKEYKSVEGAIGAAWKVGFKEVSVMMY